MDFEFSDEQEQLRESVRRFLSDTAPITPVVRDLLDSDRGTTDELWKGLAELGLTGILVPEAYGGAGLGLLEMGVVLEEMGRTVYPGPYLASALGAVSVLRAVASEAEQAAELPALADGSRIASIALFEGSRGESWQSPATRAVNAGCDERLTGCKTFVPDALASDALLVSATCDDGYGLWLVEANTPGLSIEAFPSIDGTRKLARVSLVEASGRRLGPPGGRETENAVSQALDWIRTGLAVDGVGAATACFDLALAYAKEREQFGKPIGAFQAVQHLLCDMLTDLELGRAGAYYALWAAEHDPADRRRVATMAKAFTSDAFPRIAERAIQIFAGVGFTWEYDIHLYYKRLLSLQYLFGGVDDQLEVLAQLILDEPG